MCIRDSSETLVELDLDYRRLAESSGVPGWVRVPAVGTAPAFIAGLAALVRNVRVGVGSGEGVRVCGADRRGCALAEAPR